MEIFISPARGYKCYLLLLAVIKPGIILHRGSLETNVLQFNSKLYIHSDYQVISKGNSKQHPNAKQTITYQRWEQQLHGKTWTLPTKRCLNGLQSHLRTTTATTVRQHIIISCCSQCMWCFHKSQSSFLARGSMLLQSTVCWSAWMHRASVWPRQACGAVYSTLSQDSVEWAFVVWNRKLESTG